MAEIDDAKSTMNALTAGAGPDWEMRRVPVPTPGPGQLLVKVCAAGVNRADLSMLTRTYNPALELGAEFPAGIEMSGRVAAVGPGADGFAVGDAVMGISLGAFAEYSVVDYRMVVPVPDSLSWAQAAALPVGLITEHDALVTQGGFVAGQSVLIVGATSAVGLLGVQLARSLGAGQVIGTTTSATKRGVVLRAGADRVVDTTTERLADAVLAATGDAGVDLVIDHVGGQLFTDLPPATHIGGTIVSVGRLAGPTATIDLDAVAYRRLRIVGTTFTVRTPDEVAAVFSALRPAVLAAVDRGEVHPVIDRVFAFADAPAAARYQSGNTTTGKVVLDMPAAADERGRRE